jgi:hypothetical protein
MKVLQSVRLRGSRNTTLGVGCTERALVVGICSYSFALLHSVNVSALQTVYSNNLNESTAKCKAEGIQETLVTKHRYIYYTSTSEQKDGIVVEMLGS